MSAQELSVYRDPVTLVAASWRLTQSLAPGGFSVTISSARSTPALLLSKANPEHQDLESLGAQLIQPASQTDNSPLEGIRDASAAFRNKVESPHFQQRLLFRQI